MFNLIQFEPDDMNISASDIRVNTLLEIFPDIQLNEEVLKHTTNQKKFELFINEKSQKQVTSDDEFEFEFKQALANYKGKKEFQKRRDHQSSNSSGITSNNDDDDDNNNNSKNNNEVRMHGGDESWVTDLKNLLLSKNGVKDRDMSEYVKSGAIPKRFFHSNKGNGQSTKIEKKYKSQKTDKPEINVLDNKNQMKQKQQRKNHQSPYFQKPTEVFKNPFFYVVPKCPSLDYSLPSGLYYVTPKQPEDLVKVMKCKSNCQIIRHPKSVGTPNKSCTLVPGSKHTENRSHRRKSCDSGDESNTNINAFDGEASVPNPNAMSKNNVEMDSFIQDLTNSDDFNGAPIKDSGFLALLNDFEKFKIPNSAITSVEVMKSLLESKRTMLAVLTEKLNDSETLSKIYPQLESKVGLYTKNYEFTNNVAVEIMNDQYWNAVSLFPDADENCLKQKINECGGDSSKFLQFLAYEFSRLKDAKREIKTDPAFQLLLSEFPESGIDNLYHIWNGCLGNESKVTKYIENKRKLNAIQVRLGTEFSDWEESAIRETAEKYLNDDEGLENFISSTILSRNIQSQLLIMKMALPEVEEDELLAVCEQLKGDEELVYQFIQTTQKRQSEEAQLIYVASILPDADTDFLKTKITEANGKEDKLNKLVDLLLESHDYPKMAKTKTENDTLWQTYVMDFDVENFLLEVTDINSLDVSLDKFNMGSNAFDEKYKLFVSFLMSRYTTATEQSIKASLEENSYNLLLTCKAFNIHQTPVPLIKSTFKHADFDKSFLLLALYIDHERDIQYYLENNDRRLKIEEEDALASNAYLECFLCLNDKLTPSLVMTCSEGHLFCKICIRSTDRLAWIRREAARAFRAQYRLHFGGFLMRYIEVKISNGIYEFPCPADCPVFLSESVLQRVLPRSVLKKASKKQLAEEVKKADVEGLEYCPFCEFAYIPNPKSKIFTCQNNECLKEICRECRELSHIPLKCNEIEKSKDVEARKRIEEAMSNALIRRCPNCQKPNVKIDGCNKITCTCGVNMCYVCGLRIIDYNHFGTYGCPTYSDNKILHETKVLDAGKQVKFKIISDDPTINILHDPIKSFNSEI